jgi:hypothetical protein
MSLQSRKSCKRYNRAAQSAQLWDIVEEHETQFSPLEDYEIDCNCEYCNPSLKTIRRNQLMVTLWKLGVIRTPEEYFIW